MNCGHDEVPDNATLCPIACAFRSLSTTKLCYSDKEKEYLGILHGQEKF